MTRVRRSMIATLSKLMGEHGQTGPVRTQLRAWMMRYMPGQLTCAEFERFIQDYQEGSLGSRERRVFDFHMDLCPMCRVYFETYLRTIEAGRSVCATVAEAAVEDLPDDLVEAILAARHNP
jgi:hypothetical protein